MFTSSFLKNNKGKVLLVLTLMLSIIMMSVAFAADDLSTATVTLYEDAGLTIPVTSSSYTYNTQEHRPYVKVEVGGNVVNPSYYTVHYYNNVFANDMLTERVEDDGTGRLTYSGRAYIEIEPDGVNTTGSYKYATFVINRLDLYTAPIECTVIGSKIYDGNITHPQITSAKLDIGGGVKVDLGWTDFKFDGTDNITILEENPYTGEFQVVNEIGPSVDLLDVGYYYIDIEGSNFKDIYRVWLCVFPKALNCTWEPTLFEYDGTSHVPTPTITTGIASQTPVTATIEGNKINAGEDYLATATPTSIGGAGSDYDSLSAVYAGMQSIGYTAPSTATSTNFNNARSEAEWLYYAGVDGTYSSIDDFLLAINCTNIIDYYNAITAPTLGEYLLSNYFIPCSMYSEENYQGYLETYVEACNNAWINGSTIQTIKEYLLGMPDVYDIEESNVINYFRVLFDITPKPITVKAMDKTMTQGDPLPTLELDLTTVSGEIVGEVADFTASLTTTATPSSTPGSYPITDNGTSLKDNSPFLASNYILTVKPGTLTVTAAPDKEITAIEITDPENYVYDGTAKEPAIQVKAGDEVVDPSKYDIVYTNNVQVNGQETTAPTVTVTAKAGSGYTGEVSKTFSITPAKLVLTWNEKRVFQYDGTPHLRTGVVTIDPTTPVAGETPSCTITGEQTNVGTDYVATAGSFEITGGKANINNYTLPTNLTETFDIVTLPIDEVKPTDDPTDPDDPTPIDSSDPDYTVEIVITWPDTEYTYNGDHQGPKPTSVQMIIKDSNGDPVGSPVNLTEGTDYELVYANDVNAAEANGTTGPNVIVRGKGGNITGDTPAHPYTISPKPMEVTAKDKTMTQGDAVPTLELDLTTVTGVVDGETADFNVSLQTTATSSSTPNTYPITDNGTTLKNNGSFLASNYTLTVNPGTLTVNAPAAPADKEIKATDVVDPLEDKVYKGEEWIQEIKITVDGTPLVSGEHFTAVFEENIDVGTATVTITAIPGSGYTTPEPIVLTFQITAVPLEVDWSDKDTFQFDGQYHVRKGTVTSPITGETVEITLTGKQKNVGEGYDAVIEITKVTRADGTESPLSNYTQPTPAELTAEFKIVTLPLPEQKPTDKPEDNPEENPSEDPETGYTVEVVVTWPDDPYIYDGTDKKPEPTKVELIIKDSNGDPVGDPIPLVEGTDYTLEYEENINAGDPSDPQPPTVIIKATDGGNFEGEIEYPFTIRPVPLVIKADNKSKRKGKENPELTYKITGLKNGDVPAFDGALETTCTVDSPKGEYPIYCDGYLTAKDNPAGHFLLSNYEITYIDGVLKVTTSGGGGGTPSVPNDKIIELGVDLRSGSPDPNKGNPNHYRIVDEEVIYWVDYINGGDDISSTVNLVLNLPLDFEILDSDGGTVNSSKNTITWKFPSGLKHDEGGTKEVHLKYTKFSKEGITSEDIYPMATIAVISDIKDKSSVHNVVYTDGIPVEVSHKVYMWGDLDTPTFRPTDYISRAEGAMVLLRIFDIDYQDVNVVGNEFPDLGDTYEQAQKAIVKATDLGLINGYEDGTYRPNRTMTRAEFMKLIAVYVEYKAKQDGIEGIDLDDTKTVTKYAAQNTWANKYVTLLNRLNLTPISEENPDLDIEGKITRAEVAQLCNLYLMRAPVYDDGKIELPFEDVDKNTEHWGDIVEATRPSHEHYDLTDDAYEVWDYNDWLKAYEEGFTNKVLY